MTLGSLLPGCRLDYDGGWWERPPPATRWRKFDSRTWHHMYVVVVLTPRVFLRGVFVRGFFSGFPGLILPLKATLRIPIRSRNNGQEELLTEYPLLNSHLFLYILKKPFAFWWFKINSDEKTGKIRDLIQRPSFCRHRQQPRSLMEIIVGRFNASRSSRRFSFIQHFKPNCANQKGVARDYKLSLEVSVSTSMYEHFSFWRLKNFCAQTPYRRKRVRGRNAESCILVSVRDRFKRQTKSDKKRRYRRDPSREIKEADLTPNGRRRRISEGHQPLTSRGMGAWDGAASGRVGVSQNCCETGINLVFLCS